LCEKSVFYTFFPQFNCKPFLFISEMISGLFVDLKQHVEIVTQTTFGLVPTALFFENSS